MTVTSEGTSSFKLPLLVFELRSAQVHFMISSADHILGDYNFNFSFMQICFAGFLYDFAIGCNRNYACGVCKV